MMLKLLDIIENDLNYLDILVIKNQFNELLNLLEMVDQNFINIEKMIRLCIDHNSYESFIILYNKFSKKNKSFNISKNNVFLNEIIEKFNTSNTFYKFIKNNSCDIYVFLTCINMIITKSKEEDFYTRNFEFIINIFSLLISNCDNMLKYL